MRDLQCNNSSFNKILKFLFQVAPLTVQAAAAKSVTPEALEWCQKACKPRKVINSNPCQCHPLGPLVVPPRPAQGRLFKSDVHSHLSPVTSEIFWSLKTYWEKFSRFKKYVLKSRKYQNVFLKTRKINSLRKIFLSLLQEIWLEIRIYLRIRQIFLILQKLFLARKYFLFQENCFYFETIS